MHTMFQEARDFLCRELQREAEKDILLCDLGQCADEDSADVVVDPESARVCGKRRERCALCISEHRYCPSVHL